MTAADVVSGVRIADVWRALGGGELRHGRGRAWWRNGDGYSVALDEARDRWFDHRDGGGGGVLGLIQHVRGGSRADAVRWLADWRCVRLDGDAPPSPADRRRHAQAQRDAPELAGAAGIWWTERKEALERAKADALARGDDPALAAAAREHYRLGTLRQDGAAIIREYLRARRADPESTAALLAEGEGWKRISEALVTIFIAREAA
jgi:hypothetical protein